MRKIVEKIRKRQILSRFVLRNHVFSANVSQNVVAFTFDDGPSPVTTRRLVDLFAAHQGHASFFFQGNHAEQYPDIVKYTHAAGCSVCNHSYDHAHFDKMSAREMCHQIDKTNAVLEEITGEKCQFLRPPGHRFTQWEALNIWLRCRQLIVQANIAPMDWADLQPDELSRFLCNNVQPGSIVCLHDASESTIEALVLALPTLRAQNYRFVSLAEMKQMGSFSPYRKHIVNDLKKA